MSQPVAMIKPVPADLSGIRKKFQDLADAKAKVKMYRKNLSQWEEYAKGLEKEIAKAMGNATRGVIDGQDVVVYEPKDQFAPARFAKDYPDLAEVFTVTTVTRELDWRALLAKEPEIAGPYQTRVMRVLD